MSFKVTIEGKNTALSYNVTNTEGGYQSDLDENALRAFKEENAVTDEQAALLFTGLVDAQTQLDAVFPNMDPSVFETDDEDDDDDEEEEEDDLDDEDDDDDDEE